MSYSSGLRWRDNMRLDGHGVPAARMGDGRLVLPVVVGGDTEDTYRHGDGRAANQCRTRSRRYPLLVGAVCVHCYSLLRCRQ
jgi:hypothetical protein